MKIRVQEQGNNALQYKLHPCEAYWMAFFSRKFFEQQSKQNCFREHLVVDLANMPRRVLMLLIRHVVDFFMFLPDFMKAARSLYGIGAT